MIKKLANVVIVVKDQTKALDFYTKVLGFDKRTDLSPAGGPRWVTVGPKGQDIEISLFQEGTPPPDPKAPQLKAGSNPQWTLQTDDCRADSKLLKGRGVNFDQEPADYPWGVLAIFRDPDGNPFSLLQPKRP